VLSAEVTISQAYVTHAPSAVQTLNVVANSTQY